MSVTETTDCVHNVYIKLCFHVLQNWDPQPRGLLGTSRTEGGEWQASKQSCICRSPSLALLPEHRPPPTHIHHRPWKNCLPRSQSLVPKWLGTTAPGYTTRPDFSISPSVVWGPETSIWLIIGTRVSYTISRPGPPNLTCNSLFLLLPGRDNESSGEIQKPRIQWGHYIYITYIYIYIYSIHSFMNRHLGCFHIFAIEWQ